MNIEIALVVTCPDIKSPANTKILTIEKDGFISIPTDILTDDNTIDGISEYLLKKYTGLQAKINGTGWIELTQSKVIEDRGLGLVTIPYFCMIPEIVTLLEDSKWMKISDVCQSDKTNIRHLNILQNVSMNI